MIKEEYNISDSEIRVIEPSSPRKSSLFPWRLLALSLICLVLIALAFWLLRPKNNQPVVVPGVFEQEEVVAVSPPPHPLQGWFGTLDTIRAVGTVTKDTTVNDIPLRIYVPLNSTPHLELGYGITGTRQRSILFFQAADVRADNKKIVGAFVLKGKPLSHGLSKRGYCAIIDGKITVGVADNSPLFEQATDQNGYFFRQYPLVDNGQLVENELKNKSIRRALCDVDGHIAVVETESLESLHDFAQALVDLSVDNAIYLVGGGAMGWSMDLSGQGTEMGQWEVRPFKNISFIVWPK